MFNFLKSVEKRQTAGWLASSTPGKEKIFISVHDYDPDPAHRDEVAGGAVGVQHLNGLAEGDVSHSERSRKTRRRPNPVFTMELFNILDWKLHLNFDLTSSNDSAT